MGRGTEIEGAEEELLFERDFRGDCDGEAGLLSVVFSFVIESLGDYKGIRAIFSFSTSIPECFETDLVM